MDCGIPLDSIGITDGVVVEVPLADVTAGMLVSQGTVVSTTTVVPETVMVTCCVKYSVVVPEGLVSTVCMVVGTELTTVLVGLEVAEEETSVSGQT